MGPKYNAATSLEELGSTKTYRRSKCTPNRVKVPNLTQAAKSNACCDCEGGGKGPPFHQYMPKVSFMGPR